MSSSKSTGKPPPGKPPPGKPPPGKPPPGKPGAADEQAMPSNAEKDPHQWSTGAESMTGAQASYLKTLSEEAGVPFDPALSKAEASLRIDEPRGKTGRGRDH